MSENYRKSIASLNKFPQFTTMNVIDGQAGLKIYSSLIFYSLTINNILNIVILLILAGVTINMVLGENGIIKQATNAKEKTELAGLKEQVELEVLALNMNQNDFTSSEVIDKLVESGILESDRTTFKNNSNYSLSTNGDILYNGNTIETVELTNNITSLEVNCLPDLVGATGTRMITCKDGTVQYTNPDTDDKAHFTIIANTPPIGKKFAYWINKYNNIVSYNSTVNTSTLCDNTYTAIYVDEQENITKTPCINIYSTNKTLDGYLIFNAFYSKNTNNNVSNVHVGTIATANINLANESNLTIETTNSEIYYKVKDATDNNTYDYYWTKSNVGTDTWYCRGYATLTYSDGTTETIYTDIISAKK